MLYVVVRHRRAALQRWQNAWLDDDRLDCITTSAQIGRLCQEARDAGHPIYVHRCAWKKSPPTVCCSAVVEDVTPIDAAFCRVRFDCQHVLNDPPPIRARRSFYLAVRDVPDGRHRGGAR
jgi:hypothetical protein